MLTALQRQYDQLEDERLKLIEKVRLIAAHFNHHRRRIEAMIDDF